VFRHVILHEMPVNELAEHFSPDQGHPTAELYSMAGLLLIMEFKNWTVDDVADAYMYNANIQYALNLGRDHQSMTTRTIERYQKTFRENKLAKKVMNRVGEALVQKQAAPLAELVTASFPTFWIFRASRRAFC